MYDCLYKVCEYDLITFLSNIVFQFQKIVRAVCGHDYKKFLLDDAIFKPNFLEKF